MVEPGLDRLYIVERRVERPKRTCSCQSTVHIIFISMYGVSFPLASLSSRNRLYSIGVLPLQRSKKGRDIISRPDQPWHDVCMCSYLHVLHDVHSKIDIVTLLFFRISPSFPFAFWNTRDWLSVTVRYIEWMGAMSPSNNNIFSYYQIAQGSFSMPLSWMWCSYLILLLILIIAALLQWILSLTGTTWSPKIRDTVGTEYNQQRHHHFSRQAQWDIFHWIG